MQLLVTMCKNVSAGVFADLLGVTFFLNVLIYADDILLFSRSIFGLKMLLLIVNEFCALYDDLQMNKTKSVLLTLNDNTRAFELFGLKHVKSTEYLGTILNDKSAEVESLFLNN